MSAATPAFSASSIARQSPETVRACPVCGAHGPAPAGTRSDRLWLFECRNCGLGYVHPVPDATSPERPRDSSCDTAFAFRLVCEALADSLPVRVLEIGRGERELLDLFSSRGAVCTGIGIDAAMSPEPQIPSGLPLASSSQDVIVARDCLGEVVEPLRFLDEAARLLAPGGLLYISTPNWRSRAKAREDWAGLFEDLNNLVYFSDTLLRSVLSERGFEVESEGCCGGPCRHSERRRMASSAVARWARGIARLERTPSLRPLYRGDYRYAGLFRKLPARELPRAA